MYVCVLQLEACGYSSATVDGNFRFGIDQENKTKKLNRVHYFNIEIHFYADDTVLQVISVVEATMSFFPPGPGYKSTNGSASGENFASTLRSPKQFLQLPPAFLHQASRIFLLNRKLPKEGNTQFSNSDGISCSY